MTPDELEAPDWAEKVLNLPREEQVEALATVAVHGASFPCLLLDALVRHRGLFVKVLTEPELAQAIHDRVAGLIQAD